MSGKAIFVYPLDNDFRARTGLSPDAGGGALTSAAGLKGDAWAQHEFGDAPLGDARLSKRLVKVAAAKAQAPEPAFSAVAKGDWAQVLRRLPGAIDLPDESAVTLPNILAPHRERPVRRMRQDRRPCCACRTAAIGRLQ